MKNSKKLLSLFLIFGLLTTTLFLYRIYSSKAEDVTGPLEDSYGLELFQGGYEYLIKEHYDEAIEYYESISEKISDVRLLEKNSNLLLILKRLQSASSMYYSEKELLVLAEDFKYEFLDPWYNSITPVYDFYDLSMQVILEKDYEKEEELINTYLDNKEEFSNLFRQVKRLDTIFLSDLDKDYFYLSVYYSVYPTEMFYKTAYLDESISEDEMELVELAWNTWGDHYMKVMDYYQNFEEGLYLLNQEVEELKEGYQDMKSQLTLLVPELKPDSYL